MIALARDTTVALAYALGLVLLGCLGYVLGVVHERYEAHRTAKDRKRELA